MPVLVKRKVEAMLNILRRRFVAQALLFVAAATIPTFTAEGSRAWSSRRLTEDDSSAGWRMYTDKTYGFSIKYPRQYVVLPERDGQAEGGPARLHRVRFQDRKIASWQTANLEPPQFTIEVFEGGASASLRDWLQSLKWVRPTDTVESFEVEGAKEGVRLRSMQQLAPNEFYYVATEKYVYRLTPLGEHSPQMLASFRLKPRK
jgi:hypothetical protein